MGASQKMTNCNALVLHQSPGSEILYAERVRGLAAKAAGLRGPGRGRAASRAWCCWPLATVAAMALLSTGKGASDVRLVVNSSAHQSMGRFCCCNASKKKNGVNSKHRVIDDGRTATSSGVAPAAVLLGHEG